MFFFARVPNVPQILFFVEKAVKTTRSRQMEVEQSLSQSLTYKKFGG